MQDHKQHRDNIKIYNLAHQLNIVQILIGSQQTQHVELHKYDTSGKKAIGGALFWLMRGAYGMRHHCHTTSNNLSVHRQIMRGAYWLYAPLVACENSKN
jgi:hypothetical protein